MGSSCSIARPRSLGRFYSSSDCTSPTEEGRAFCLRNGSYHPAFVGVGADGLAWVTPESAEFQVDLWRSIARAGRCAASRRAPYNWRATTSRVCPRRAHVVIGSDDGALWVLDVRAGRRVVAAPSGKEPQRFVVWSAPASTDSSVRATLLDPATGDVCVGRRRWPRIWPRCRAADPLISACVLDGNR